MALRRYPYTKSFTCNHYFPPKGVDYSTPIHAVTVAETSATEAGQTSLESSGSNAATATHSSERIVKLFASASQDKGAYHIFNPLKTLREELGNLMLYGHGDAANKLICKYADHRVLLVADDNGRQPLHVACQLGLTDIACTMLDLGSPLDFADKDENHLS